MNNKEIILMVSSDPLQRAANPSYQKDFDKYFILQDNQLIDTNSKLSYSGIIKLIYPSGKPFAEYYYQDGLQEGKQELFYENGSLKAANNMIKGFAEGIQLSFYENGVKYLERTYKNGIRDGNTIYFYPSGKKREEGYVHASDENERKDMNEGLWIYYHENGMKKEEGEWAIGGRHRDSNIRVGTWKYYNEKEELINTEEYSKVGIKLDKITNK